ncbi:MAG: glycoside hydrolase family 9 protein [Dysgonomonas sp.]|nr:glycoside hydrolase family 9 protein [Dysgonomonas sp.]
MGKFSLLGSILFFCVINLFAQGSLCTDKQLEQDILGTGMIHSPLTLDDSRSEETRGRQKRILNSLSLTNGDISKWKHSGLGKMTHTSEKSIRLAYPNLTGKRAQGPASDPDYATYGNAGIYLDIESENWEKFNRIVFRIYPDCEGARVTNLNLSIENGNNANKEGYNRQSGSHLINLKNRQWNECYLDIDEYQRDKIKKISFGASIKGKDRTTGDSMIYYIDKIELQQIENLTPISGWVPAENTIIYSTSGYLLNSNKTAIVNRGSNKGDGQFQLINADNQETVFNGQIIKKRTTIGELEEIDFTSFDKPGNYILKAGNIETPAFQIGDRIWDNSLWRVLNFIFCQRCGYPVPGKHGTCHLDLCSKHDGKMISYAGGWHDAGDLSQQTLQTADVTFALLEGYNKLKNSNPQLASRMLEEAEWGLEFVLRSRYGDGYRASSVGLLIWQDGIFGTLDDISSVRVQNLAFDNFLYAGYEAYAALSIDRDPRLQEYLKCVAKEDFEFALHKHKKDGYGEFIHFYEHSYNTSESQYMATVSWAASMLYKLTKDPYYAQKAVEFIKYTLDCQRTEPLNDKSKTKGFFYRDKSKKVIVHYNHQSREQVYMQAMTLLCETQPQHADYKQWAESVRLYGDYLKNIMKYTAPYGMIPSGVYHIDEAKDKVSFQRSHLFIDEHAPENYMEQLKNGIQLDKEHYIKRFPVAFSIFNGNTAVHLATGKAAAICGNFLKDEELLQIGKEQLYWTVGKNPFGQSLIYGEGYNYPQMDTFSSGEMVGEMPVGIRSLGNEDIPYWPPTNNATYKEVWVTSAGKWITLIAEY